MNASCSVRVAVMPWQLKVRAPFGVFAVQCDDYAIIKTAYLPTSAGVLSPQNVLAGEVLVQFKHYCRRPRRFVFDLPLLAAPTPHQQRCRKAVVQVPSGETRTYGDIAATIGSSARAVGGACRANPVPLLVPCHRIVAANGVGGFMGEDGQSQHPIKMALLRLENNRRK